MLRRILKILLSIPAIIVYLISGMITISLNWSFVCTTYSALSDILYQALMKPISILIAIFGLSALNLLILTFYLICKYSLKHKHNSHQYLEEIVLPNKEECLKLLKYIASSKFPIFSIKEYSTSSELSEETVRLYLKSLSSNKLIKDHGYTQFFIKGDEVKKISIRDDGMKYLNKHKLIK